MAIVKAYTDIEQSKKLAEILPIESADMWVHPYWDDVPNIGTPDLECNQFPCWSLAALLNVLPKYEIYNNGKTIQLDVNLEALATEGNETLIDLVVNMIIHLHKQKLL